MRDSVWLDRYNAAVRERDQLREQLTVVHRTDMDEIAQLREKLARVETVLTVFECRTIEETPGDATKLATLLRRALAFLDDAPKEKP